MPLPYSPRRSRVARRLRGRRQVTRRRRERPGLSSDHRDADAKTPTRSAASEKDGIVIGSHSAADPDDRLPVLEAQSIWSMTSGSSSYPASVAGFDHASSSGW